MNPITPIGCMALLVAGTAMAGSGAEGLLEHGEVQLEFRYRFEYVDQDGFARSARASTVRTRLNLRTGDAGGWSALVEFDDVREVGADDFNAGGGITPDRVQYPVVADPPATEVNQAFLQYVDHGQQLRLGRQRINLDNQRFVGAVGWRQNEQTFDALSWDGRLPADVHAFYAYVTNVNRIFGPDSPAGDEGGSIHLVNLSRPVGTFGTLTAYFYDIDNDERAAASTTTAGLRFSGKADAGGHAVGYTAELAHQRDAHDNALDYSQRYIRLDGTVALGAAVVGAGYELLGGDAGRGAFVTPLATLHAFNGWADQFLDTPAAGLENWFGSAGLRWCGIEADLIYHEFRTDDGDNRLGTELDLSLSRELGHHWKLLLAAADFRGDDATYADTRKVWLMLTGRY